MKPAAILLFLTAISVTVSGVPLLDPELEPRSSQNEVTRKDNFDERGDHYGGDMILNSEQLGELKQGINGEHYRWPGATVPYVIDPSFPAGERHAVQEGINMITSKTCVKFIDRTTEPSYLYIRRGNDGTGCYSHVGKQASQPQVVNLQGNYRSGTCAVPGIVAHELTHALGFYHEQSRTDRDDFITINWSNINHGASYNFDKLPAAQVSPFGVHYDYDSLMHYSAYAFARNPSVPTLVAKQSGVRSSRLGQRNGLSATDAQKINAMYRCS